MSESSSAISKDSSATSDTLVLDYYEQEILQKEGPDFYIRTMHRRRRHVMREFIKLKNIIAASSYAQVFPGTMDAREELNGDQFYTPFLQVEVDANHYTELLVNQGDVIEDALSRWCTQGEGSIIRRLNHELNNVEGADDRLYRALHKVFEIEFHSKYVLSE